MLYFSQHLFKCGIMRCTLYKDWNFLMFVESQRQVTTVFPALAYQPSINFFHPCLPFCYECFIFPTLHFMSERAFRNQVYLILFETDFQGNCAHWILSYVPDYRWHCNCIHLPYWNIIPSLHNCRKVWSDSVFVKKTLNIKQYKNCFMRDRQIELLFRILTVRKQEVG
jgi:hypothetical protein